MRPFFAKWRIEMIKSTTLDKFAILLSGMCLLHCLVLPIAFTLLPIFSINALVDDELFHQLILWLVIPISTIALFIGCFKHRNFAITGCGVVGMTILILVAFWGHDVFGEFNEKLATSAGGLILAFSHFLNFRACQSLTCNDQNCSSNHHH